MSANLMSLARSGGKFLKLFGDRKMMKLLPYLRRVKYLESSGTQYIETKLYPKSSWTFDTEITCLRNNYNCVYWGVRSGGGYDSSNLQCYLNSNTTNPTASVIKLYSTNTGSGYNWSSGIEPIVGLSYLFTGITVVQSMQDMTYPIVMFGLNNKGVVNTEVGVCRIGLLAAYDKEVLIAKYIPVIDLSGRPAMYDEVSGQFFYNQGTGEFTWGELDSQTT